MTASHRIVLEQAFVLHNRPFRNTSALVEAITREYGRVGLVARGARGARSSLRGLMQPFIPLLLSWSGRGELFTLTGAEAAGAAVPLSGQRLITGLYLNELLMRLMHRYDPHPELFDLYAHTLVMLSESEAEEPVLRRFELGLLQAIGYALILDHDAFSGESIAPDIDYVYDPEHGPRRASGREDEGILVKGATLLALACGCDGRSCGVQEKRFMRAVIAHHLGGRPLNTRSYFATIQ